MPPPTAEVTGTFEDEGLPAEGEARFLLSEPLIALEGYVVVPAPIIVPITGGQLRTTLIQNRHAEFKENTSSYSVTLRLGGRVTYVGGLVIGEDGVDLTEAIP